MRKPKTLKQVTKELENVLVTAKQPINTGAKYDAGKERFDLIEPNFELEMAKVLTHGAELYGAYSWKTIQEPLTRYTAALKRHTNRMARGEIIDPSTGLYHAAQIAVNAMFLHHFLTVNKTEW